MTKTAILGVILIFFLVIIVVERLAIADIYKLMDYLEDEVKGLELRNFPDLDNHKESKG